MQYKGLKLTLKKFLSVTKKHPKFKHPHNNIEVLKALNRDIDGGIDSIVKDFDKLLPIWQTNINTHFKQQNLPALQDDVFQLNEAATMLGFDQLLRITQEILEQITQEKQPDKQIKQQLDGEIDVMTLLLPSMCRSLNSVGEQHK